MADGLRDPTRTRASVLRSLDATRWQRLRFLEAPSALPAAFTGMKVAAAVAVIGAVLAEWSGSDVRASATCSSPPTASSRRARAFAATVLLIAEAVALYVLFAGWNAGSSPGRRGRSMKRLLCARRARASLVAGCGEKAEPTGNAPAAQEPFTVMLDYVPNADHAGHLRRPGRPGLYAKAGLDVKLQPPPDPSAPLKLLRAGQADLAISYEPELLLARDAGADDLVAVGALVQTPLTSLMALPAAGVKTPKDLAGKRVGTAGIPYQSAYLKTILEKAGVDPARSRRPTSASTSSRR